MNFFQTILNFMAEDTLFWILALSGTGLFIIQFVLNLLGADTHNEIDTGCEQIDSGRFHWLSTQALTGFLMMFGWVGLTCKNEFALSSSKASFVALIGGLLSFFVTNFIFKTAKKLRSSGLVFVIEDAVGKQATVYQRIPKGGFGKISLSLNNLTYEIDAISPDSEELPSFMQVQVIKTVDEKTVIVIPIK